MSLEFKVVKGDLPSELKPKAIEHAVWALVNEIDVPGDKTGFFNQTLKTIAQTTILNGSGDFWLAHEDGVVMAYAIAFLGADIDDKLTYRLPQAWLHPKLRGDRRVKEWWELIRKRAIECMAQHILIISARNAEAFCRWMGHNAHLYATLLKEDL